MLGSIQDETLAKQTALNQMVLQWHRHCRAKDRAELLALKGATRNMFNQGAERVAKSSINAAVKSCYVALLAWGHESMSWGWAGWQHSVRENKRRAAEEDRRNLARRRSFLVSRCMDENRRHDRELFQTWLWTLGRHMLARLRQAFREWLRSIEQQRDEQEMLRACAEAQVLHVENDIIKESLTSAYGALATSKTSHVLEGLRCQTVLVARALHRWGFDAWRAVVEGCRALRGKEESHRRRLMEVRLVALPSATSVSGPRAMPRPGVQPVRPNPLLGRSSIETVRRVIQRWFSWELYHALVRWQHVVSSSGEAKASNETCKWWEKPRWWEELKQDTPQKAKPNANEPCRRCELHVAAALRHKKALTRLAGLTMSLVHSWDLSLGFTRWQAWTAKARGDEARSAYRGLEGKRAFLASHIAQLEEQLMQMESKNLMRLCESVSLRASVSPSPARVA